MTPQQFWLALTQRGASAVKWLVIGSVLHAGDWRPFVRLCVILVLLAVMQIPLDLWLLWR